MTDLEFVKKQIENIADETISISESIWEFAELPYEEERSAKLLCNALEKEGFILKTGIAGIPTAFTATYAVGTGKPVIGLLGEYDALDALSQKAGCPTREPIKDGAPGHGCGHNLLGAGSFAAAVAVKEYLKQNEMNGTVVYFGCPAEEGAGSKQFMARAGIFNDVDFVYTWHPTDRNEVSAKGSVAIMGAAFSFKGVASHAGGSPHLGRSALDSAELMSVGANYLREHMIEKARIHYAYSDAGGVSPNVVQSFAKVKYEVRAPKVSQMKELFARVVNVAKGASLMTDTEMDYEITMAFSDYVPNRVLAQVASVCFNEVGAPEWDTKDEALAASFLANYNKTTLASIREDMIAEFGKNSDSTMWKSPLDTKVRPFDARNNEYNSGSTDVGDVAYATPTLSINVASACFGTVWHSWQTTAQMNSSIGNKGMLTAAKVMALACIRTAENPDIIQQARNEWMDKTGGIYHCPLPSDVTPPIGRY
ncbi:MAG: amidohydrolase [Clostridia bacterium]|nr:amidohydrolase [Clostridia bacterium]